MKRKADDIDASRTHHLRASSSSVRPSPQPKTEGSGLTVVSTKTTRFVRETMVSNCWWSKDAVEAPLPMLIDPPGVGIFAGSQTLFC